MNKLLLPPAAVLLLIAVQTATAQTVLFDFGPQFTISGTNGGTNGPDINGNYWNNVVSNTLSGGNYTGTIVTISNTATAWALGYTTGFSFNPQPGGGTWASNGISSSLGNLAINTAMADGGFVTGTGSTNWGPVTNTLVLSNLNTNLTYNLRLLGTRDAAANRFTVYSVAGFSTNSLTLQTSGSNVGGTGTNFNNSNTADFSNVIPGAGGVISISYANQTNSQFGYLNAMEVVAVPEPGTAVLLVLGGLVLAAAVARRRG